MFKPSTVNAFRRCVDCAQEHEADIAKLERLAQEVPELEEKVKELRAMADYLALIGGLGTSAAGG